MTGCSERLHGRRTRYYEESPSDEFLNVGSKERNRSTYEIPVSANSVTNMPPPACAKPAPYDAVLGLVVMQPSFELVRYEQSVELMRVDD